jgi:hypothetical protein
MCGRASRTSANPESERLPSRVRQTFPAVAGDYRRSILPVLVILVLFGAGAYLFAGYVVTNDIIGLAYIALISLGAVFAVAIVNNWRTGVYCFLAWLLFEDLARKYLGNNMAIYFAKDALVALVYLSFFIAYRRRTVETIRPPFLAPMMLFVWFGILQVFNPGSATIVYGILGVKLFFTYIPMFWVGYALLNSELELRRFFNFNVLLILPICGLGIAQSIIGPGFLNPSNPADEIRELSTLYRTAPISGVTAYRASAVFVSHGRYGNFLEISWIIVLGFTGYLLLRQKRGRKIALITVSVVCAAALLATSRGVFMWCLVNAMAIAVAFIWGAPWRQGEVLKIFRSFQRMALGIVLALVLLFFIFPDALFSRLTIYSETLMPGSVASELQNRTWDYPLRNFLGAFNYERWPIGYGIGTSSLGTQYVAKFFPESSMWGLGVESGFGTLVVEMGLGGLVLWLIMGAAIVVSAWRIVRKLKGTPWFPIAFVIFWYAFILLFPITFTSMPAYQDFVLNTYLWLLLGILFRLPKLIPSAQFAAEAAPRPKNVYYRMR